MLEVAKRAKKLPLFAKNNLIDCRKRKQAEMDKPAVFEAEGTPVDVTNPDNKRVSPFPMQSQSKVKSGKPRSSQEATREARRAVI